MVARFFVLYCNVGRFNISLRFMAHLLRKYVIAPTGNKDIRSIFWRTTFFICRGGVSPPVFYKRFCNTVGEDIILPFCKQGGYEQTLYQRTAYHYKP